MAAALSKLKRFGTYEREGHFIYIFASGLARIQRGDFNENSVLREEGVALRFTQNFKRIVNRIYSATNDPRDTSWIDKTPDVAQVRAVPVINKLWPDARYIYLYRPPEAAVRSSLAVWSTRMEGREAPTAERWAICQRAWRSARAELGDRYREIYQPDMLSDPAGVARTLQPLLGLRDGEVDTLAEIWGQDQEVNRPRGDRGKAYDAATLSPDAVAEVHRLTKDEVAHWPVLAAAAGEGAAREDG